MPLNRTVAVKLLQEHIASDPDLKERFEHVGTVSLLNLKRQRDRSASEPS
jgi:hypothetical protein